MSDLATPPQIGDVVHWTQGPRCCAAIITAVSRDPARQPHGYAGLRVFQPHALDLHQDAEHDAAATVGTWHRREECPG